MTVIYIVMHSLWGHQVKMANAVKAGLDKVPGVTSKIWKVRETLPEEVLQKMHAAKFDYPIIEAQNLPEADGFVFGLDTRFGMIAAQTKSLLDATGQLWMTGALKGKFASVVISTATQKGGTETTALTTIPFLAHHGINFVPLGWEPEFNELDEVIGGSAWGAGTHAKGDGSRQPSEKELSLAERQGVRFGSIVHAYMTGKAALEKN